MKDLLITYNNDNDVADYKFIARTYYNALHLLWDVQDEALKYFKHASRIEIEDITINGRMINRNA
jgi:hypothetical protein